MPSPPYLSRVIIYVALIPVIAFGQEEEKKRKVRIYEKTFQFSLFPGISSNGISSGSYINRYSLNLFGGLTAGNRTLEIGVITNSHFQSSSGLQFAGLANIIGTNAFVNLTQSEERSLIREGFVVNNKGIQFAGFLNYVLNHVTGAQISGALNHVGSDFNGLQLAGIGNSTGGVSVGVHLAGFYNLAKGSMAGIQVSSLFNYTDNYLAGTQIALINKARYMRGKNSTPHTSERSLQIGLLNFSKRMHGTQIGLINFGGEARGTQIGLINFFKEKTKEFADAGTPIGLLNLGSAGSVFRAHFNEIFPINIEYTTGNCQNCTWNAAGPVGMPFTENNKKFNQNALAFGYHPSYNTWSFGWGFQKILLNKASMHPLDKRNELRVLTYGIRFLHLNREWKEIDKQFNLVSRLHFEWGRKGLKRFKSIYRYAGVALNYFVRDARIPESAFAISSKTFSVGKLRDYQAMFWPGYSIGLQL